MKKEAELIYHQGDSPWPCSRAQPCCEDRLCWRLTQIQEAKVLIADGDKDLKPCEYWHGDIFVRYQHSRRPSCAAAQSLFLALTERFDFPRGSDPSTCGVVVLTMLTEEPGPRWRHKAPNPSVYPRGKHLSHPEQSLLKHPGCRKLGLPPAPVPRAPRPSPRWDFSQDVLRAQVLQDIFLLSENRADMKSNEAKAYYLDTLQVKTWKPSRRQNNLCSPSRCSKSAALSWQQKWIW